MGELCQAKVEVILFSYFMNYYEEKCMKGSENLLQPGKLSALSREKSKPYTKAVFWRCSVKSVFLIILQNSQENTCVGVSFVFSCEFCKIFKSTLFYSTPSVAAFAYKIN